MAMLFAAPAWACEEESNDVLAVSPEHGADEVPVDAVVVLQVRGRGSLDSVGVDLVDGRGVVPGEWRVERTEGSLAVWTFVPQTGLEPGVTYSVALEAPEQPNSPDSAYVDEWIAEFTTGNHMAAPLLGAPSVELGMVGQTMGGVESRCEPDVFRRVELTVTPGPAERPSEEWFLVYLLDDSGERLLEAKRLDSRDWSAPMQLLVPGVEDSFCLVGVHRSGSGQESASEPTCFDAQRIPDEDLVAYYGGGSCSTGAGSALGLWLLLPWFMRRRAEAG